jgi:competence protein ComGC
MLVLLLVVVVVYFIPSLLKIDTVFYDDGIRAIFYSVQLQLSSLFKV